ncbi:MAG: hypothetical protein Q4G36_07975 [Paracoccus sp. (in: a-proteobacteria)]|nr:hypothetical protein [Paracoccus sp. (in: a-proteobacteria)]
MSFEQTGLQGGIWSGLLSRDEAPARVALIHMGEAVAQASITDHAPGIWRIEAALPAARLSDGVQSFLLVEQSEDGEPDPGAPVLARLNVIAGKPLDADLRAEIDLLRAELDLVKREFRRLARG